MRNRILQLSTMAAFMLVPAVVSAHVEVHPSEVGIATNQTFVTSVPNEEQVAVTGLRLVIPAGLAEVSAIVKPGWTITQKTSGDGEDSAVTEIDWTGGTIPAGESDVFSFNAQSPAKATTIDWKAYQTYADGKVVAWDQTPNGKDDESLTPYSTTKVIDDLAATSATEVDAKAEKQKANLALGFSIASLLGSLVLGSMVVVARKK